MNGKTLDRIFEIIGTVAGLSVSALIGVQIVAELHDPTSSLSLPYTIGFAVCYVFWAFYGLRFKRLAISLTNGIAFLLQLCLLIIVLSK